LSGLEVAKRRAARLISEISINYRRSPIVSEHRAGLIADVMHMGSGLRAGDRAPDAEPIQSDAAAGANRLYEAMRGPHFNLLIFAGLKSNGDLEDMHAIADAVSRRCGNAVRTHLVVLDAHERIAGDANVIRDPKGALHRAYGADSRCLYLIRPDNYVGFRAFPPDQASLLKHLDLIFK
jgi:hypothetical protein